MVVLDEDWAFKSDLPHPWTSEGEFQKAKVTCLLGCHEWHAQERSHISTLFLGFFEKNIHFHVSFFQLKFTTVFFYIISYV